MPLTPTLPRILSVGAAVALLAQAGCKKVSPTAPVAVSAFTVVQGNNQVAQAGTLLSTPIVLRVTDATGDVVPNATVVFAVVAGGGSVSPATAQSDANGEVTVQWTLGQSAAIQSLSAAVDNGTSITIDAAALFPATIIAAQGNNQTGKAGQALLTTVVIRVTGTGNVPLSGIPVQFQVVTGGGSISPQTALTNAFGEVTVKWTLGAVAGPNSATATASTLTPVQLSATGTP